MRIAVGAAALEPCDIALDLGNYHPSTHGGFALTVEVSNERIVHCEPHIGYVHRSAEKLFEARDYRQILMLANRHDWISPQASEISVAQTIERASGITPTAHAAWTRLFLMEANRVSAAIHFLSYVAPELADLREQFSQWQESTLGARVHPMFVRVGGLLAPIPEQNLAQFLELATTAAESARVCDFSPLEGKGILHAHIARELGASGPIARATGINNDLRAQEPDPYYTELQELLPAIPQTESSDAADRFRALSVEIDSSLRMLEVALVKVHDHADEPVEAPLPKTFKVPVGTTYHWTENPQGIHGVFLVSSGDRAPLRMKLRTPAFSHIQCMARALEGSSLDDCASVIASFFIVPGDMDR